MIKKRILSSSLRMLRNVVFVLVAAVTFGTVTASAKTSHDRNVVSVADFKITSTAAKAPGVIFDAKPTKRSSKRRYSSKRRSRSARSKRKYRSKRRYSKRRYRGKRRASSRRYRGKRRASSRRASSRRYRSKRRARLRRTNRSRRTSYRRGRGGLRGILASVKPAGLPMALAAAVVSVESNWRTNARGSSGEIGLMQLMPATARMWGGGNMYDPRQNMRVGTKYLHWCYKRARRSIPATIGCYNRGPGKMWQWSGNPITRRYVAKVRRMMRRG